MGGLKKMFSKKVKNEIEKNEDNPLGLKKADSSFLVKSINDFVKPSSHHSLKLPRSFIER